MALLIFNAGRSNRRADSNFVDPVPTKGAIQIVKIDDLLHFQWKNRATGDIEEDLIIFPSEADFVQATGRTYVLKFSSSSQRHFFWMQDLSDSKDAEYAAHVNGYLADPDYEQSSYTPAAATAAAATPQGGAGSSQVTNPLGSYTQEQYDQLRALMAGFVGGGRAAPSLEPPSLSLTDIITPANLAPVFASKTLLQTLYPFLPTDLPAEQPPSEATIRRVIESPQFQTGVRSLDQALSTGLLGDFVTSLGLPAEAGLGVEPFLKAIIEQAKTDRSEEQMETD